MNKMFKKYAFFKMAVWGIAVTVGFSQCSQKKPSLS